VTPQAARLLAVLCAACAGSGCGTLTNLESPRTLAPGRWTVELEGRAVATRSDEVNDAADGPAGPDGDGYTNLEDSLHSL